MRTAKQNISPKIPTDTRDWYGTIGKTVNAGATYALEAFPVLYKSILFFLRGRFTAEQLKLIVQCFENHRMNPQLATLQLTTLLSNLSLTTGDKQAISQLLGIISALNPADCMVLEVWAHSFWISDEQPNLDEFISPLV